MSEKEALKIVRNLVKVGVVNSLNPAKGTVKVLFPDKDNIVSNELPLLNFEYHMPEVGSQVLCLFLGNGLGRGFCLGEFYSNVSIPPANNKDVYKKKLDDSTFVEYNKGTKFMKVKVEEVEIQINQGKVTIKADEILLGEGASEGVPSGPQLKEWLDNHTHEYTWTDLGGSGTTSPPGSSPAPSQAVKI